MKLYADPISTTSRPVILFIDDTGAPVEFQLVELMKGGHMQPEFVAINPSHAVPVLQDDELVLTESSAILKYLADKIDSPPSALHASKRAWRRRLARSPEDGLDLNGPKGTLAVLARDGTIYGRTARTGHLLWRAVATKNVGQTLCLHDNRSLTSRISKPIVFISTECRHETGLSIGSKEKLCCSRRVRACDL